MRKEAIIAALLALALTAGAAGCTATGSLNMERDDEPDVGAESASYGNVSTTRNGVVNGDNRNLVAYGERFASGGAAGGR